MIDLRRRGVSDRYSSCRVLSVLPGNEKSSTTIHNVHDEFLIKTCDGTMTKSLLPPLQAWEAYFTPTNRYRERAELGVARYARHLPAEIIEMKLTGCTRVTWEGLYGFPFAGPRKIIWTGDDDCMTTAFGVVDDIWHRSPIYDVQHSTMLPG